MRAKKKCLLLTVYILICTYAYNVLISLRNYVSVDIQEVQTYTAHTGHRFNESHTTKGTGHLNTIEPEGMFYSLSVQQTGTRQYFPVEDCICLVDVFLLFIFTPFLYPLKSYQSLGVV